MLDIHGAVFSGCLSERDGELEDIDVVISK